MLTWVRACQWPLCFPALPQIIGPVHLPEDHPPKPGVRLPDDFRHLAHGHLVHEQQGKGFKLHGKVRAQPLPRWPHPEAMTALPALAARQPTGDLKAVLENIQTPPRHYFRVVVTGHITRVFGAGHQFPQLGRLPNLQKRGCHWRHQSGCPLLPSLTPNPPIQETCVPMSCPIFEPIPLKTAKNRLQ